LTCCSVRFVGLGIDDPVWDHSVFSKNRDRPQRGMAAKFLSAVLAQPGVERLLSTEHFSVDGTLIDALASMKGFKPTDGSNEPPADGGRPNLETDFHGHAIERNTHIDHRSHAITLGPDKAYDHPSRENASS
jgi:hypothetical protein